MSESRRIEPMRTEAETRALLAKLREAWKAIPSPKTFNPLVESMGTAMEVLEWVLGERVELDVISESPSDPSPETKSRTEARPRP